MLWIFVSLDLLVARADARPVHRRQAYVRLLGNGCWRMLLIEERAQKGCTRCSNLTPWKDSTGIWCQFVRGLQEIQCSPELFLVRMLGVWFRGSWLINHLGPQLKSKQWYKQCETVITRRPPPHLCSHISSSISASLSPLLPLPSAGSLRKTAEFMTVRGENEMSLTQGSYGISLNNYSVALGRLKEAFNKWSCKPSHLAHSIQALPLPYLMLLKAKTPSVHIYVTLFATISWVTGLIYKLPSEGFNVIVTFLSGIKVWMFQASVLIF